MGIKNMKKTKYKDNFEVMVKEIAKYIESHGGLAITLGGVSIEQKFSQKCNYRFVVDFTGKPPRKIK